MTARWSEVHDAALSWSQLADLQLADAWIAELARRTSPAASAAASVGDYALQQRATAAAFEAASYVYRALNLPPLSDPAWRVLIRDTYGPLENNAADAIRHKVDRVKGSGGVVGAQLATAWRTLGQTPLTPTRYLCAAIVRHWLRYPDGLAATSCPGSNVGDGDCSFSGNDTGCAQIGATVQGCDPWKWTSWAWYTPFNFGLGADDGAAQCRIERALPPLEWSFALARAVSNALSRRGAARTLDDARLFVAAKNAQTALELELLPADLAAATFALPAALHEAQTNSPEFRRTAALLGVAATTLLPIAPPVGAVAAGILGAVAAVIAITPAAVGFFADDFGRAKPVFERATIATTADGMPGYDVPDPPGWARPRLVILGTISGVGRPPVDTRTATTGRQAIGATAPPPDGLSTGAKVGLGLAAVGAVALAVAVTRRP